MRKVFLAVAFLGGLTGTAAAHGVQTPCNPYYIMEHCNADGTGCGKAHLHFAAGHSLASDPSGSYWYRKPHRWLHHDMFGHEHKVKYTEASGGSRKTVSYKRLCVPHHHN